LFPGCLTIGLLSSCPSFCTWSCSCQSVQIKFLEYQCLRTTCELPYLTMSHFSISTLILVIMSTIPSRIWE
jgi:hypothetical protein